MRGLSTMLSHAIYLALGIMVMGALLIYAADIRVDMDEQTMNTQLSIVAESVKDDVFDLYLLSKDSGFIATSENISIARIDLDFPERIGDRDYEIILQEDRITVSSSLATVTKEIDIDINMEGTAKIPAYLELVRETTGDTIRVVGE